MNRITVHVASGMSCLCAVIILLFTIRLLAGLNTLVGGDRIFIVCAFCAAIPVGPLLLVGAVMLWMRTQTGQTLVIVASSVTLAITVTYSVYNYFHGPEAYGRGDLGAVIMQILFGAAPALTALLFAAATPIRAGRGFSSVNGRNEAGIG